MSKGSKYLQKKVVFGGKTVTLFSIDGVTWSTRSDELHEIKARQEQERENFGGQIRGGPQAKIPTARPKATAVQTLKMARRQGPAAKDDVVEEGRPAVPLLAPKRLKEEQAKTEQAKAIQKPSKKVQEQKVQPKSQKVTPKKRASGKPIQKAKGKLKKKVA